MRQAVSYPRVDGLPDQILQFIQGLVAGRPKDGIKIPALARRNGGFWNFWNCFRHPCLPLGTRGRRVEKSDTVNANLKRQARSGRNLVKPRQANH